jgi:hypothetical protein
MRPISCGVTIARDVPFLPARAVLPDFCECSIQDFQAKNNAPRASMNLHLYHEQPHLLLQDRSCLISKLGHDGISLRL